MTDEEIRDPEKGRRTRNRSHIVGVEHIVQAERSGRQVELAHVERLGLAHDHCDPLVVRRIADFIQLIARDQAVGLAFCREILTCAREEPRGLIVKEEAFYVFGCVLRNCLHGGETANRQEPVCHWPRGGGRDGLARTLAFLFE